jgi:hypothetical protein
VRDLYKLSPNLSGWVPHVLVFVVPRQVLDLGDPSKRSCDACESLGASVKQIIRQTTCRRRSDRGKHLHTSADGKKSWYSSFSRGYIEQAFRRVCVRSSLIHGSANSPYLQRKDHALLAKGKVVQPKCERAELSSLTVYQAMTASTVWGKEAALAVWSQAHTYLYEYSFTQIL